MSVKENDYTCGTCKHQESCAQAWSFDEQDLHNIDQTTCADWTDPDEPELTEDERYDGGVMSNFDNENPKEVEDYINERRERE